jgi:hypothetical protein
VLSRLRWAPQIAVVVLFVIFFAWNSWHCDDAFITLRVLDNRVRGRGPALERARLPTSGPGPFLPGHLPRPLPEG